MEPHFNIQERKILVEVALKKAQLEVQVLELSRQKAESEVRHALLLERKAAAEFDIIANKAESRGSLGVENKIQQVTVPKLHHDILGEKRNIVDAATDSDLLSRPEFLTKTTIRATRDSSAPPRQIAMPKASDQMPMQLSGQAMMLLQSIQTSFSWNATSLQDCAVVLRTLEAALTREGMRPRSGLLEEEEVGVVTVGTRKRGRSGSSTRSSEDEEDSGGSEHLELSDP